MNQAIYDNLRVRELFHLEFLRWLGRKVKAEFYVLKGGTNLRFFFKSFRYSEDMDLDIHTLPVERLQDIVMEILNTRSFLDNLRSFNIARLMPPDMAKAKQTQTTQRFKIHLITAAGEDLFTKVEFSRRGIKGKILVQPVADTVMREYKLAPLLVPHYDSNSAVSQKIDALATRSVIQARDILDLFILSTQYAPPSTSASASDKAKITKAHDNIFAVGFEQFRDTVVSYLSASDQETYGDPPMWDEIKLKTAHFLEEIRNAGHG
ncbi:MAG: nucleotidyl transferase AbiEii/AbiGii toxin family protein [Methanosarcinaceae archaeon]|nr:nucleotidyl transferase AbiEii/AbiGii toxin family protein [Methanosarcinaceae archaeon]